jgi:hypothetical protein
MSGNATKEKKRQEKLKLKHKLRAERYHNSQKLPSSIVSEKDRKLGTLQLIVIATLMLASTAFIFYQMNS